MMPMEPAHLSRAALFTGLVPQVEPTNKLKRVRDRTECSNRILRPIEVSERLSVSRAKVYQLIAQDKNFPARKKISSRVVGWIESEIDDYIASLPDAP